MAKPWLSEDPDLESHYNQLSRGEIEDIPEKPPPGSIEDQLEILPPEKRDFTAELVDALRLRGVDDAVALCKQQQQRFATSMVQRDCAFARLIMTQLSSGAKLFTFRGAAHEPWLCRLLDLEGVRARLLRFAEPSLQERLVAPLTIGATISEADVLRHLYWVLNLRKDDYEEMMALGKRAEATSECDIRSYLTNFGPREHP
jgi:hypothetical protein